MANKYIEEVGVDVRKSLPALQGLNIDTHIPKARTGIQRGVGQAIAKMAGDMADYNIELTKVEMDKEMRALEVSASEEITKLPPGWASSREGLDQYNAILDRKIKSKKELVESNRGKIGKDAFDEYNLKISEGGAQDYQRAQTMNEQFIIQSATYRKSMITGNIANNITSTLYESARAKESLGLPVHKFTAEDIEAVDREKVENLRVINEHPQTSADQKMQERRETLLNAEKAETHMWFTTLIDSKAEEFQLVIDGVPQKNLTTGLPEIDPKSINRVINEGFDAQEHQFSSGAYEKDLINKFKIDPKEAREITKAAYGQFSQDKLKMIQQMEARQTAADKNNEARMLKAQEAAAKESKAAYDKMGSTLKTRMEVGSAYSVLSGSKVFDAAYAFRIVDGQGRTSFEEVTGIDVDTAASTNMYISDAYTAEHVSKTREFGDAEKFSVYLTDTLLKEVPEGSGREVAIRSLAYTLRQNGIPLSMAAVEELAKSPSETKDEDMRKVASAILSHSSGKFQAYPDTFNNISPFLNASQRAIETGVGGVDGVGVLKRYVTVNMESLKEKYPKFKKAVDDKATDGVLDARKFDLVLLSEYNSDPAFRKEIDSIMPSIKRMNLNMTGSPIIIDIYEKDRLMKKAGDEAGKREAQRLEEYGIRGARIGSSGVPGRA
ncbi:MAG: hypothetical protein ACRDDH_09330 [Cetobacterium sp.]|uniref:hypothetical protein n=1 Tax=Cetobacterium sp. TaxID=2071632 RepID=UPI003EE4F46D